MAEATVLGSLLIQLGMDSAQFERATQRAQSSVQKMSQSIGAQAKDVVDASNRMGVSVTSFARQVSALQTRINPGQQALANYRKEATLLKEAFRIGAISQEQFRTQLRAAIQDYSNAGKTLSGANDNIRESNGSVKAGMQQLGYQLNDMATMWAMGAKGSQIFSSQIGQVVQAIQLMSGGTSKLAAFLGGPWGIALTVAVTALAPFIGKLLETTDALDNMRKAAADAMDELRSTMAGGSAFSDAIDKNARLRIEAMGREAKAVKDLRDARAEANATPAIGGTVGGTGAFGVSANSRIASAQAALASARADRAKAEAALSEIGSIADAKAMQDRARAANDKSPEKTKTPRTRTPSVATDEQQTAELTSLDREYLQARLAIATNAEDRADLEWQLLSMERDQRLAEIDANKRLTDAQRKQQKAAVEKIYGTKANGEDLVVVGNSPAEIKLRREQQARETSLRNDMLSRQAETLQAMADIEPNTRKRAELERQALDLQQQIQSSMLEQQIANGDIADADQARAELAKQQAVSRQRLSLQTMSPMESYRYNLQTSVANINDAMEGIQVNAMQGLTDGIASAIAGTQKLGDVFKNVAQQIIADLARIAIQKAIVGSLGSLLGGGSSALSGFSFESSWFNDPTATVNLAGARAAGGPVRMGLPYLVGERGPEIVVPGQSGQVIPNHELSQMGGGGGVTNNYYGPGAEEFWGQVNGVAASNANQAVVTNKQRDTKRSARKLGRQ